MPELLAVLLLDLQQKGEVVERPFDLPEVVVFALAARPVALLQQELLQNLKEVGQLGQ